MPVLSQAQASSYASAAGFSGNALAIILAIAHAESGLNTTATNTTGNSAGTDRGIIQINSYYHPEVSDAQAFNPATAFQAGYKISSNGTNFTPWSTYTSGIYKRYLTASTTGSTTGGATAKSTAKSAASNIYSGYVGQCTWWADERYHQVSGVWVPWSGNANQWLAGAKANGWQTSTTPPAGHSIICFQAGVQEADPTYGHVAVVETINKDGSVQASNMNWRTGPVTQTVQGFPIRNIRFVPGNGVSFLSANASASSTGSSTGSSSTPSRVTSTLTNTLKKITVAPNADVTQFLADLDGMFNLINPFTVDTSTIQDSALGVNFTDPAKWVQAVGNNFVSDTVAILLRLVLILLGLFLLYKVVSHFVDVGGIAQSTGKTASSVLSTFSPLLLA